MATVWLAVKQFPAVSMQLPTQMLQEANGPPKQGTISSHDLCIPPHLWALCTESRQTQKTLVEWNELAAFVSRWSPAKSVPDGAWPTKRKGDGELIPEIRVRKESMWTAGPEVKGMEWSEGQWKNSQKIARKGLRCLRDEQEVNSAVPPGNAPLSPLWARWASACPARPDSQPPVSIARHPLSSFVFLSRRSCAPWGQGRSLGLVLFCFVLMLST